MQRSKQAVAITHVNDLQRVDTQARDADVLHSQPGMHGRILSVKQCSIQHCLPIMSVLYSGWEAAELQTTINQYIVQFVFSLCT